MSVSVTVRVRGGGAPGFIVAAVLPAERREALGRVMGERLADEIKDHFRGRNSEPNKMGAAKSNFWNDLAQATGVSSADADGAVVTVADERFRIHFHGGTIVPKQAKALTIPLIPEARGKFVRDYEKTYAKRLFRIPGVNVLFEQDETKADRSTFGEQRARVRGQGNSIRLRERTPLRAVYALAKSATFKKDPNALPDIEALRGALVEEANDFMGREKRRLA